MKNFFVSDFAENWLSCSLRLKMCAIFEFSDFAQKWYKKSDSSLKVVRNFTNDFRVKNFSMGILYKINPDQI